MPFICNEVLYWNDGSDLASAAAAAAAAGAAAGRRTTNSDKLPKNSKRRHQLQFSSKYFFLGKVNVIILTGTFEEYYNALLYGTTLSYC